MAAEMAHRMDVYRKKLIPKSFEPAPNAVLNKHDTIPGQNARPTGRWRAAADRALSAPDHSPDPPCRPPEISSRVFYDGRTHPVRKVLRRAVRGCTGVEGPRIGGVYVIHEQEHTVGRNAGAVFRLSQFHHGIADAHRAMHD